MARTMWTCWVIDTDRDFSYFIAAFLVPYLAEEYARLYHKMIGHDCVVAEMSYSRIGKDMVVHTSDPDVLPVMLESMQTRFGCLGGRDGR